MAKVLLLDPMLVQRRKRADDLIESLHARLDQEAHDWKRKRQELALAGGFNVSAPISRRKRGSYRNVMAPLWHGSKPSTSLSASASTGGIGVRSAIDDTDCDDHDESIESRTPSRTALHGRLSSLSANKAAEVSPASLPFPMPTQECCRRLRLAVFNACEQGEVHPAAASCMATLVDTPWFLSRGADLLLGGEKGWEMGATLHTTWTPLVVATLVRSDDIKMGCLVNGSTSLEEQKASLSNGYNDTTRSAIGELGEDMQGTLPFDVLLVPGGSASTDAKLLGSTGLLAIREFVRWGGGYCGICAGAFLALRYENDEDSLALVDGDACMHDGRVRTTLATDEFLKGGHETLRNDQAIDVRFTTSGRLLLWDENRTTFEEPLEHHKNTVRMRYSNGPQMVARPDSKAVVLGTAWPVASAKHSVHPTAAGSAAILMQEFGQGRAVLISPHAESTHESLGGGRAEPGRARLRRVLQRAILLARAGHKDYRWLENACHLRVCLTGG